MNNKKEWLKAEVVDLIERYHAKPELWDVQAEVYKNLRRKDAATIELSERFQTTTGEITRKIHNLKNQLYNEIKKYNIKKTRSGKNAVYISKWVHFQALSFLLNSNVMSRSTKVNIPTVNALIKKEESDIELSTMTEEQVEVVYIAKKAKNKRREKSKLSKKSRKKTLNDDNASLQRKVARTNTQEDNEYLEFMDTSINNENSDVESSIRLDFVDEQVMCAVTEAENKQAKAKKALKTSRKGMLDDNDTSLPQKAAHVLTLKDDEFDIFGSFVASEIRIIKNDILQKKIKRRIQEIILEINEEDEEVMVANEYSCSNRASSHQSSSSSGASVSSPASEGRGLTNQASESQHYMQDTLD